MKTAKELKKFKQELKKSLTPSEKCVKEKLISLGIDFKCQMILGFYILDFVIVNKLINIEIDGGYHKDTKSYDKARDRFVLKCGLTVVRINNEDVTSYDFKKLLSRRNYSHDQFRRALALANSFRGKAIKSQKQDS